MPRICATIRIEVEGPLPDDVSTSEDPVQLVQYLLDVEAEKVPEDTEGKLLVWTCETASWVT